MISTACDKVNEWTGPTRSHDITHDSKLCSQPLIFIVLSENFSLKVERDEFIKLSYSRNVLFPEFLSSQKIRRPNRTATYLSIGPAMTVLYMPSFSI